MENTAPLKDAHQTAMVMVNARLTMHWNGNAFVTRVGTEQDATSISSKIALTGRIMMAVSTK